MRVDALFLPSGESDDLTAQESEARALIVTWGERGPRVALREADQSSGPESTALRAWLRGEANVYRAETSEAVVKWLAEDHPESQLLWYLLARIQMRRGYGHRKRAAVSIQRALELEDSCSVKVFGATVMANLGRVDDARRLLSEVELTNCIKGPAYFNALRAQGKRSKDWALFWKAYEDGQRRADRRIFPRWFVMPQIVADLPLLLLWLVTLILGAALQLPLVLAVGTLLAAAVLALEHNVCGRFPRSSPYLVLTAVAWLIALSGLIA